MPTAAEIESVFRSHRRMLWGLCYRMTGVAADADELVQETFLRALERGPDQVDELWHRWLVRVATRMCLDRLRRRKRAPYTGPWLPSPLETPAADAAEDGAEDAYERVESLSYAFLIALETLSARARAVVLLSEVFDHSAAEVGELLGLSEANVRVVHHRARQRLDRAMPEPRPLREVAEPNRTALAQFVSCLMRQDVDGAERLLAASVRTITDGGGEFTALLRVMTGRQAVLRFHLETARRRGPISNVELRHANGLAAMLIETRPLRPQMAPRVLLRCEIDADGLITELHSVLAPRKLTAVRFATA